MVRGRVELKKIENKINRQVTFSKRRNGLQKKACELSVLCEAEVALIIFSSRGKLYEFCSNNSDMQKVLEKYEKCNFSTEEPHNPVRGTQEKSYHEYMKLRTEVQDLQQYERNLKGEDLGALQVKDLDRLEKQLDMSLKQVRSTKTRYMLEQLTRLQEQEQRLHAANKALHSQLQDESAEISLRMPWETGTQRVQYSRQQYQPDQSFFQPLECNTNSRTGYNSYYINGAPQAQNVNGLIPEWMLNL